MSTVNCVNRVDKTNKRTRVCILPPPWRNQRYPHGTRLPPPNRRLLVARQKTPQQAANKPTVQKAKDAGCKDARRKDVKHHGTPASTQQTYAPKTLKITAQGLEHKPAASGPACQQGTQKEKGSCKTSWSSRKTWRWPTQSWTCKNRGPGEVTSSYVEFASFGNFQFKELPLDSVLESAR